MFLALWLPLSKSEPQQKLPNRPVHYNHLISLIVHLYSQFSLFGRCKLIFYNKAKHKFILMHRDLYGRGLCGIVSTVEDIFFSIYGRSLQCQCFVTVRGNTLPWCFPGTGKCSPWHTLKKKNCLIIFQREKGSLYCSCGNISNKTVNELEKKNVWYAIL